MASHFRSQTPFLTDAEDEEDNEEEEADKEEEIDTDSVEGDNGHEEDNDEDGKDVATVICDTTYDHNFCTLSVWHLIFNTLSSCQCPRTSLNIATT
jgi:hypothetical protein